MTTMFESAKEQYAKLGIDVEAAMDKLAQKAISVHCWQGDDVLGFDQEGGLSHKILIFVNIILVYSDNHFL